MKKWWQTLLLREKQMLVAGLFFIACLCVYLFIWSPTHTQVVNLRSKITQDEALLTWMQHTAEQIHFLEKSMQVKKSTSQEASLLSILQKALDRTPLAISLTQLRQTNANAVEINLQNVDFDKAMTWLIGLTRQHDIIVTKAMVTPSATVGMVSMDLVLMQG